MTRSNRPAGAGLKQDLHGLPAGWVWARLADICNPVNGRGFKSSEWRASGVPIIRIRNLKDPEARFNHFQGELDEKHRVRPGDLLFAWSGTPGTSFGAHIWRGREAALNQHIFNVRFDASQIDPKYFQYALNQNVSRYVEQAQGGVGLAHITKAKFLASHVPLAPPDQQRTIVAEIEKQFSRLDEAVPNLKRVKANLKRYKAAVLKAAVEGRLVETEADLARCGNRTYETGAQLLERIVDARRAQCKGKGKYKEPTAPDTTDLPKLPEGWTWTSIGQLFDVYIGATPSRRNPDYWNGGIPWVSSGEVAFCRIRATRETISREGLANSSTRLHPVGTVLLGMIGEGKTRGQAAILDIEACTNQNAAAIRVSETDVRPDYLYLFLEKEYEATRRCGSGGNQPALNKDRVKHIAIPLPPLEEQLRMVAEVDRRLSLISEIEGQVDADLARAERLRQVVLKQAFSGRLVSEANSERLHRASQTDSFALSQ